jgi:hypothetical protein
VLGHGLTVEHALPQNWVANWPLPDGVDCCEIDGIGLHVVLLSLL